MSTFSIEGFAVECKAAMDAASDRQAAAAACLARAIEQAGADVVVAALEAAVPGGASVGEMIVHASPELTMLYARVPPRFQSGIHDHTVFACIAQLRGEEINTLYERTSDGLREVGTKTARPGEVVTLPADVIHGIANPGDEPAAALHLYGGDFGALMDDRSLYGSDDHERLPFSFPALVRESVKTMHRSDNRAGLRAVAEAIPAVRPVIDAL